MNSTVNRLRSEEQGYVIVTVAILLFVLLGFASLAVDLGILYSARTQAQRAADAAALAGAFGFVVDPYITETEIKDRAVAAAAENGIMGQAVAITPADVAVDMVNQTVVVTVERTGARGNPVDTYLARGLGFDSADIGVRAAAEAATSSVGDGCTKPWIVPSTIFSGPDPCQACLDGQVLILDRVVQRTFVNSIIGQQFTIKPNRPSDVLVPSNFMAIELGNGSGANVYRENIINCAPVDVSCNAVYRVEPGNMRGPTVQGVQALVGDPPDQFWDVADYGPNHADTSQSLIVAPIWDACNDPLFQIGEESGGKGGCACPVECVAPGNGTFYTVAGFALLFINGVDHSDGVQATLINVSDCGGNLIDPQETGPFSIPIRLIQIPGT